MSSEDTVPTFASVPHPRRLWRLVDFYLRDKPDLQDVARLLSVGVTDSRTLSGCLEVSLEEIELRKIAIHQQVAQLRRRLARGHALASRFRAPSPRSMS